ncbi:MAG TPA: SRPBCC family protein [Steroidobacteraceae bacterium]
MTMLDGTVLRKDGGYVVAFDRLIDRPAEKIWAALTDPKILANWLGDVEVDLRVGGAYIIRFRKMSVVMVGTITGLEPGRLIEYSWLENYGMPGSVVRWEISPADRGCRLRLAHSFPPECALNEIVGFAGGWHAFLDVIPTAADGVFAPYGDEKALDAGYRQRYLGDAARDEGAAFLKLAGVRLERLLPGPIERVWNHLTKPELLPRWFGDKSRIEPQQGGVIRLMDGHVRGIVTQWAPPHRLSYTWNVFAPGDAEDAASAYPESYLTLTLEPRGENVMLTLVHMPVLDRFEQQNAMGWHTFLDIVRDTLAGQPVRTRQEYMVRNAARYGVDLNDLAR